MMNFAESDGFAELNEIVENLLNKLIFAELARFYQTC